MGETWYLPTSEAIIADEIDGEVIIVDMDSGRYFTVSGAGVPLWNMATTGAPRADIIAALARAYPGEANLEADVERFLQETVDAGLPSASAEPLALGVSAAGFDEAGSYVRPALASFDDMKDLILIDPIHEVGEEGWPVRKTDAPAGS